MPVYEYWCTQCCEHFEVKKAIVQRHNTLCPKCEGECKLVMSVVNHKNCVREENK